MMSLKAAYEKVLPFVVVLSRWRPSVAPLFLVCDLSLLVATS